MKIKKLCNRLIKNIKIAVVSDNLRRKLLFYFLNAALSLTSFIMTIINILPFLLVTLFIATNLPFIIYFIMISICNCKKDYNLLYK